MQMRVEKVNEELGQTDGVLFVSPFACDCHAAADAFARDLTSDLPGMKSAATTAEACTMLVPVPHALARTTADRGMKVTSVELYYKVADAACTAVTVGGYKVTLKADGTIPAAASIAGAKDLADNDCVSVDEHKVTWTPTTPAFLGDNEAMYVKLSLTKAVATNLWFYGALVNFQRRL